MDKKQIQDTLNLVKEFSPKRNFKQSIDIIISLKEVNVKKQGEGVDTSIQLPEETGRKVKICALLDVDMKDKAELFDKAIMASDFDKIEEKEMGKIAKHHDFFVAEAKVMPQIATKFGRTLGPLGKMPSPKLGSVLMPNSNTEELIKKLKNTLQLKTKDEPMVKAGIGYEDMEAEKLASNVFAVYEAVEHVLPKKEHNIRGIFIKTTMGPSIKVGMSKEKVEEHIKEKLESKKKAKEAPKEEKKTKEKPKKEIKEEKKPKKEEKKKEAKK